MQFIIKTKPEELLRAKNWWHGLEMQWKFAYNETCFAKGTVLEPPKDEELMMLLVRADTFRFAGPLAPRPNMSTVLTNLSGLVPLYHITYLSLSHTKIKSLQPLKRHTQMKFLFVYDNEITSLEGIEDMIGLESLYIQNNQISDLSPIKKLTNIQTLYASNNRFAKIKGLTKKHGNTMKKFYITPNENLLDREIIRIQNKVGIICRQG